MPLIYQLIYFLTTSLMLALACLIFFRRPKERIVQAFTAFVVSIAAWVLTLYLYYIFTDPVSVLLIGRLNFAFAELFIYCAFLFVYLFPIKTFQISRGWHLVHVALMTALVVITVATSLIDSNEIIKGISRETEYGPLYPIFLVQFLFFGVISIVMLIVKYRKLEAKYRSQVLVFALGWAAGFVFGVTTNILIPLISKDFDVQNLGPIAVFFLAMATGYAVARHQLLEVKALATELFVMALLLLFVVNVSISTSPSAMVIGLLSLGLAAFLGVLVISSIKKEIVRREEIQHLASELSVTNKRLRQLDDLKTTMVSIASHQIRGPLGGIRGYLSMFRDGDLGPLTDKQKEIVILNLNVTTRLLNAVETFLDITKLESGALTLRKETLPLDDAVEDVYKEFELPAEKKGIKLSLSFKCPRPVWVDFDPEKIKHVIFNLIDNALKYTETGSISVIVHCDGREAVLEVTDTGMGILPEDASRLFGKYERGELVIDRGGSGLGLYVVKMLTEMQDGRVWAASPGVGKGSTFGISLPMAKHF